MGTWLQIIADVEASQEEAPELAEKMWQWLVSREIIDPTPIPQLSDPDEVEYAPAANAISVLDDRSEADRLHSGTPVSITLGRTVFHTYQGGFTLVCEKCGAHNEDGENWGAAISEWYENIGPGVLACETCSHALPITQWPFDPPWGFGFLGFTFWDWPTLNQTFIEEMAVLLQHKVVYIYDKL